MKARIYICAFMGTNHIDLVVDFSEMVDLFTYAHLIEDVQNLFNKRVDMITVQGIKPALKNRISNEVEWIERS